MLARVGLRKTSLVDFPGRVAAVLFTPGCNFRCPYCHNAALVVGREDGGALPDGGAAPAPGGSGRASDEGLLGIEEATRIIEGRAGRISGIVLSGGEPLLHPELPGLAGRFRRKGLAVKLDTNGSFPDRMTSIGADYVALDLKTVPELYPRLAPGQEGVADKVLESLEVLRRSGADYEIRITCAPGFAGPAEAEGLAALLERRDRVLLQAFRPGGCLDPAWDQADAWPESDMAAMLARIRQRAPLARIRGAAEERKEQ